MNTTFNFNRLALLLKRYFRENLQREITYWAIITIVFVFIHQAGSVSLFLYISGLIFAAQQFKIFSYTPSGMHYMLIPATHTEKLTSAILISTLYYFIMVVVAYLIGNSVGTYLGNMIFNLELPYEYGFIENTSIIPITSEKFSFITDSSIFKTFGTFALIQSTFILGSLYFKRNPAIKTLLSGFVFMLTISIIQLILAYNLYGTFEFNSATFFNLNFEPENSLAIDLLIALYKYGGYVALLFFWVVSYFRLTEKQV